MAKHSGGRSAWKPPDLAQVEKMAARGLNLVQIAAALGIHYETFNRKRPELREFNEAIKKRWIVDGWALR